MVTILYFCTPETQKKCSLAISEDRTKEKFVKEGLIWRILSEVEITHIPKFPFPSKPPINRPVFP